MRFDTVQIGATFDDNRVIYRRISETRAERVDTGTIVTFNPSDVIFDTPAPLPGKEGWDV